MPKTDITYTKMGDYLIPDLILPPEKEQRSIGILRSVQVQSSVWQNNLVLLIRII